MRRSVPASIGFTSSASASARLARKRSASRSSSRRMRAVGDPPGLGLEVEVDRRGDAAHVGDLHVEDHQIGGVARRRHRARPGRGSTSITVGVGRRRARCAPGRGPTCRRRLPATVAIGREASPRTGGGPTSRSAARSCTSWAMNGTYATGGAPMCCGHAGEHGPLACRRARRGRRGCRTDRPGGARPPRRRARALVAGAARAGPRPAAGAGRRRWRGANAGWTRFATSALDRELAVVELVGEEDGLVDRVAPRRRDEHEARSTARRAASRTASARARNPSSMPSKARKNEMMSSITRGADHAADLAHERVQGRARDAEAASRAGTISTRNTRLSSSRIEPLRRVEEVERVPRRRRVDDDEVVVTGLVELVQPLHRHVLLRARRARRRGCGRSGSRGCGRAAPRSPRSGRRARRTSSLVSSMSAVSRPRGGRVAVGIPQRAVHLVVVGRGEAERVGEAARRVDRDHRDASAAACALDRERGRGRWSCPRRRCRSTRARAGVATEVAEVASPRSLIAGVSSRDLRGEHVGEAPDRVGADLLGRRTAAGSGGAGAAARAGRSAPAGSRGARRRTRSRRRARPRRRSDRSTPASVASASAPGSPHQRSGRQLFTTTGPSAIPTRSSSANAVSTTSFTGVSSGSVTRSTWQRAGSVSIATTSSAWPRTGPIRTASWRPAGRDEEGDGVAGRGGVEDDEVGPTPDCSSCLTLPRRRMSRIPGTAVATTSRVPERDQAAGDPVQAPVGRGTRAGRRRPRASGRAGPAAPRRPRRSSGGHAEGGREARFAFDLDDQHARARCGRPRWRGWRRRSSSRRRPCPQRSRPGRRRRTARAPCAECYEGPPRRRGWRVRVARRCSPSCARACALAVVRRCAAAAEPAPGKQGISVVQVEGLLDPPTACPGEERHRGRQRAARARCW